MLPIPLLEWNDPCSRRSRRAGPVQLPAYRGGRRKKRKSVDMLHSPGNPGPAGFQPAAARLSALTSKIVEVEKWCAMPDLPRHPRFGRPTCCCYTNDALNEVVAASGIAPDSLRLQRSANLSQLHSLLKSGPSGRVRTCDLRLIGPLLC